MKATAALVRVVLLLTLVVLAVSPTGGAMGQEVAADIERLDPLMVQVNRFREQPSFDPANLSGAPRNLVSVAGRWQKVRASLMNALSAPGAEVVARLTAAQPSAAALATTRAALEAPKLTATRFSGFTQSETSTAWCGTNAVVVYNDTGAEMATLLSSGGVSAVGYAQTTNSGTTFGAKGPLPPASGPLTLLAGDPVAACASSSVFYVSSLWLDAGSEVSGVALSKSANGGASFGSPVVAVHKDGRQHIIDKDWMTLDPKNSSHVYITYTDFDFSGSICGESSGVAVPRYAIEMVSSPDGGQTFGAPVVIDEVCADGNNPFAFVQGSQVAVGPNGAIYVAWEETSGTDPASRAIEIAKSINGGASFGQPVVVATPGCAGDCADLQGVIRIAELPSLAIGKGTSNSGVLYLAWNSGQATQIDVFTLAGSYGFTDVMFFKSSNGGTTWSTPLRVNTNTEGGTTPFSDQFEPALGTDKAGRIAVCFYDRRRDPNNFLIDRYCASSTNGGTSFTNTAITLRNFPSLVSQDLLVAPDYMGDYDTLASEATNLTTGFLGGYANNAGGSPSVTTNRF